MFLRFCLLLEALICCGLPAAALLADEAIAPGKALVTVHADLPGAVIPPDFLGLSYEKSVLAEAHFRQDNAEMSNLCRNLGGGVLRFGGNKLETTCWELKATFAAKAGPVKAKQFIEPANLDNLYAFAKQSGWRVIHGLNLAASNPAMAADEAAYALQVGGPTVLAFEVGNEPDFYPRHALRSTNYVYRQYRSEAEAEQRVILARSPNAPMAGPATTKFCTWFPDFVSDFKGRVVLATSHFYSLSAKSENRSAANFASVENLLSASTKRDWLSMIGKVQGASRAAGIPFRLGECNSVSGGGTDGVSDVFAAALWGADFLFDVAEQGVAGINFHGGFSDRGYTPFCFRNQHYHPHPLYYAMLLFHQAGHGRVVPVECHAAANLAAHAVLGDDGKLRVVLINKSLGQIVAVSVASGLLRENAEVIRLTAPSVASKDGVTLAGRAVGRDGTWTPKPGESVQCVEGKFEVALPPASAAIVTVR